MAAEPSTALLVAIPFFILLMLAVVIGGFVFWILMIIDCARRPMKDNDKVVWILILVFLGMLGAAIYYFVIKRNSRR